jgi:hypothetical protein
MIRTDPDFPASYAQARERFVAAARARGARVDAFDNPVGPGLDGEPLATDVATLGPDDAREVLMVTSGTHGVEGLCGSGIEHALLHSGPELDDALAAGARVVLVHAINPHGFSWCRRVTEDNVDLNRNVRRFPVPDGPDPDYDEVHDLLLPASWPPDDANRAAIAAFVARREARRTSSTRPARASGRGRRGCSSAAEHRPGATARCTRSCASRCAARRACTGSTCIPDSVPRAMAR